MSLQPMLYRNDIGGLECAMVESTDGADGVVRARRCVSWVDSKTGMLFSKYEQEGPTDINASKCIGRADSAPIFKRPDEPFEDPDVVIVTLV
jgi:hypothetical protein